MHQKRLGTTALTSKTIISGEMLSTPTQCHTIVIYGDTCQKTRLNQFHSVSQQLVSLQKF